MVVVVAAGLIVFISMGLRQSFGIFLQPVSSTLGIDREIFGLAIAIQNLLLGLPLAGYLADRFNTRHVVIAGSVIYACGMLLMSGTQGSWHLLLSLGLLTGIAQSATTYVVVLSAVARVVHEQRRSAAFAMVTGFGSFGLFAMVPVANGFLLDLGWNGAFEALAWITMIMLFAAGFLPGRHDGPPARSFGSLLRSAGQHRGYLMLITGFFVCGFHVAFIATHLPAYVVDMGLDRAAAAYALSLVGLFNIVGTFGIGWLADRVRKKAVLAWLYAARAVVISGFLIFPVTQTTALVFGALIGIVWLATVPVTSGMVGQLFGTRYIATLYGVVFLGHQIGAFLGAWWGGYIFDTTGSYTLVWWTAVGLSLLAAVLHALMDDRPVEMHSGEVTP